MKTIRKSIGRFQFIVDFGFDKEDFGLGFDILYLKGMKVDDFKLDGFWAIGLNLIVLEITINIADKS